MAFDPIPLNLPSYPFKLKRVEQILYIFDEIRKKYLVLTPEEWVRQHFIKMLIREKQFPSTLIQIEGGLQLHQLQKRSDILVYTNHGKKIMLIECKAPSVKISQNTFDQAARYNLVHKAPWLVVTNGLQHFYTSISHEEKTYRFHPELPPYPAL